MPIMAVVETSVGKIGVLSSGSGSLRPMIFLHGVGSDKGVWRPQLDHFGRSRPCHALDYPGYGESDFLNDASRDDFATAIISAVDALDIDKAHVCGLSLGGVIAIAMHHAAPQRIASLVLADTFTVHPDGQAIHDRAVSASKSMTMRELAEARAALLLGSAATAEMLREVIDTMSRIDPRSYAIGAQAVWLADQRDRARAINVPTLVMVGDEDSITPPQLTYDLAALINDAEIVELDRCGHLANLEQPAAFNSAIDRFLSRLE